MESLFAARGVGVAFRDDMLRRRADSGVAAPKRVDCKWAGDWFVDPAAATVGVDLFLMMSRLAFGFKLKLSSTELSNSSRPPKRDFWGGRIYLKKNNLENTKLNNYLSKRRSHWFHFQAKTNPGRYFKLTG